MKFVAKNLKIDYVISVPGNIMSFEKFRTCDLACLAGGSYKRCIRMGLAAKSIMYPVTPWVEPLHPLVTLLNAPDR